MDERSVLLSRWLTAGFTLVFAASVVAVLFARNIGGGVSLRPGAAATLCLAAYGALALAGFRGVPLGDRLGWWATVAAAHTAFGLLAAWLFGFIRALGLEAALTQAFGGFVPASLVSLIAAPLAALPFRPRLPVRRVSRPTREAWGSVDEPEPDPHAVPGPAPVRWATSPARPAVTLVSRPPVVTPPVVAAPEPSDGRVVRVTFARIADQLPPDMLALQPDRLATTLREPGRVLVPVDLVLSRLADGAVAVPATVLDDQLPRGAVLASRPEARARWDALRLALPMDEVLAQLPAEALPSDTPVADVEVTGTFGVSVESDSVAASAAVDPVPPATGPAIVSVPVAVEERTEPPPGRRLRPDETAAVVACLAPAGRFDVRAQDVEGVGHLLSLVRDVAREAVEDVVRRLVPALPSTPDAPAIVTLVGERAALAMAAGEGVVVLAAARHPGAPVALMEQLLGRAAAALALAPRRGPLGRDDGLHETTAPSAHDLGALGAALDAFGRVVPVVLRDAGRDLDLYVFRPEGITPTELGGLAGAVDAALDGAGLGRPASLSVRTAGHRTELRWAGPRAVRAAVVAAAGTVERAGLARRQVARVTAALEVG